MKNLNGVNKVVVAVQNLVFLTKYQINDVIDTLIKQRHSGFGGCFV